MVTLEQVERLDEKVRKAVALIEGLRAENTRLTEDNNRLTANNETLRTRLDEMDKQTTSLVGAQEYLEKGILGAIDKLSGVEAGEVSERSLRDSEEIEGKPLDIF